MTFQQFVQTGLPALGAVVAIAWFLWQRHLSLERRLNEVDRQIVDLRHQADVYRQAMQSNIDNHTYLINANKELIEHRTRRFFEELKAAEKRVGDDLVDVKGYLTRTTDFKVRGKGWGSDRG